MRKITMFNMVSVDGFFAGVDGNIDWHVVDDAFNKFAIGILDTVDTLIFGRVTYELFASYWPSALKDPATSDDDRHIAQKINDATKIVFSKSLETASWEKTKLYKEVDADVIREFKAQPGGDIVIYGSGTIVQALTKFGLIDEYKLMVNPVILGKGKPLFKDLDDRLQLKLLNAKIFDSGNVLLSYKSAS